jgi:hypothetical protein
LVLWSYAGTLPEWLGSLENLEVLNLGSQAGTTEETGLHGTIPAGIGQLSKLRELNLVRRVGFTKGVRQGMKQTKALCTAAGAKPFCTAAIAAAAAAAAAASGVARLVEPACADRLAGTTEETGLHGTIPAGIGQLSKLRELNLVRRVRV